MNSRFQITIVRLLWAMFWVAAWVVALNIKDQEVTDGRIFIPELILIGRIIVLICALPTALGALFGKAFWGFLAASIALLVVAAPSILAVLLPEFRYYLGGPWIAVGMVSVAALGYGVLRAVQRLFR